jgi:hypothetical protein
MESCFSQVRRVQQQHQEDTHASLLDIRNSIRDVDAAAVHRAIQEQRRDVNEVLADIRQKMHLAFGDSDSVKSLPHVLKDHAEEMSERFRRLHRLVEDNKGDADRESFKKELQSQSAGMMEKIVQVIKQSANEEELSRLQNSITALGSRMQDDIAQVKKTHFWN